jgi:hypothetical protein
MTNSDKSKHLLPRIQDHQPCHCARRENEALLSTGARLEQQLVDERAGKGVHSSISTRQAHTLRTSTHPHRLHIQVRVAQTEGSPRTPQMLTTNKRRGRRFSRAGHHPHMPAAVLDCGDGWPALVLIRRSRCTANEFAPLHPRSWLRVSLVETCTSPANTAAKPAPWNHNPKTQAPQTQTRD